MIIYYLSFSIMLVTGNPAATVRHAFPTLEACQQAGVEGGAALDQDPKVKEYRVTCDQEEFADFTPEEAPHTEHHGDAA